MTDIVVILELLIASTATSLMNIAGVISAVLVTSRRAAASTSIRTTTSCVDTADSEFFVVEAMAIYIYMQMEVHGWVYIYISRKGSMVHSSGE